MSLNVVYISKRINKKNLLQLWQTPNTRGFITEAHVCILSQKKWDTELLSVITSQNFQNSFTCTFIQAENLQQTHR